MEINRGINWAKELADRKPKDHKHLKGISPKSIYAVPKEFRKSYLPKGENQNIGEEKMHCVSAAINNFEESELTYAYRNGLLTPEQEAHLEGGYLNDEDQVELSDAYLAIVSGTTREGNSLIAPHEARRLKGACPKKLMPQLNTFDEHHNPDRITNEISNLAKRHAELFPFRYEQISELQFSENDDDIICAAHAWLPPVNGVYQRTDLPPNHCVRRFDKNLYHEANDTYENSGSFIKLLAKDFNFMDYGYRPFFVKAEKKSPNWLAALLKELSSFCKDVVSCNKI